MTSRTDVSRLGCCGRRCARRRNRERRPATRHVRGSPPPCTSCRSPQPSLSEDRLQVSFDLCQGSLGPVTRMLRHYRSRGDGGAVGLFLRCLEEAVRTAGADHVPAELFDPPVDLPVPLTSNGRPHHTRAASIDRCDRSSSSPGMVTWRSPAVPNKHGGISTWMTSLTFTAGCPMTALRGLGQAVRSAAGAG